MSPEFHTLGNSQIAGLKEEVPEVTPPEPRSYRALVLLYLSGGADTFNMLVPTCNNLYQEYTAVRSNIALPKSQLLQFSASTQTCNKFGVHHRLPFVQAMYNQGQLAFISNVGSLVQPTTAAEYKGKTSVNCAGLFSHIDQQQSAKTLKCQVQGASPKGVGGRLGDALAAEEYATTSFSLAGMSTWSQGRTTNVEIISKNGAVQLERYQELQAIVGNITKLKYNNKFSSEYSQKLADAIASSERLGSFLKEVELTTSYETGSGLANQLQQVSRLIATRTQRRAERDLFYVSLGGFDTHSNIMDTLEEKFQEVNHALESFVAEMKGQGVFESVVLATSSEFGRTLTSNGVGTDHAWAGNHFVIGGGINGGRVFNKFPESLLEGNAQDVGRGRMIPLYPWESIMVPIAEWMGASASSWGSVFPNLARFNSTEHIISPTALFNNINLV
jgi:cullin-associated NEDD8-dissociated protein 1